MQSIAAHESNGHCIRWKLPEMLYIKSTAAEGRRNIGIIDASRNLRAHLPSSFPPLQAAEDPLGYWLMKPTGYNGTSEERDPRFLLWREFKPQHSEPPEPES